MVNFFSFRGQQPLKLVKRRKRAIVKLEKTMGPETKPDLLSHFLGGNKMIGIGLQ